MRLRQKETGWGGGDIQAPGSLSIIHTLLPKNMVLLMA